ncbi:DoxX family membrane protein [Caulobacter sp. SLTY]|uniref:DoxX family protein n=1 Tax=Caulobacter sp. SLTY TaxID=2683262 RepID=UPI0014128461|nr:DoxX family protein [Caulobacter sp. SLTY]NBB15826.1 DoxX family membrane protein [Caulobacter sp. SLTY]
MDFLAPHSGKVLSILRVVAALAFMAHGLMKIFHFPVPQEGAPDPLPPMLLAAGWLEIVGGGLLALGLFTRPVAFLMSGMMAVAYFIAHASKSFYPALNGGEPALLFCFIFFYLAFAGGGTWSLDTLVRKRP